MTTKEKLPAEPLYIQRYINDLGWMYGIQAGHRDILLYVAALADHMGRLTMTAENKALVARTVDASLRSVDNALSALVAAKILHRPIRGDYVLDPVLFMEGDWKLMRDNGDSFLTRTRFGLDGCEVLAVERQPKKRPADRALREDLEAKGQQRLLG